MMNQQYLEYIRGYVSTALSDIQKMGVGQLGAFEGAGIIRTTKFPRKPQRIVALEGRNVCAITDGIHCTETRSRKRPAPPIDPITYETSSWRRAVSELEPHHSAWVYYCYGNDLNYEYQKSICLHVWGEYKTMLTGKRTTEKVRRRIESLVWLAVQAHAAKCGCVLVYRKYNDSELAELSGVSRSTWSENYKHHWDGLSEMISQLDSDSLNTIIKTRNESRLKQIDAQSLQNRTN
ncbi:bacteriophage antitermination protein Q [Pectobacterium parmentieri]|uniref:bacteriophage antitermination protein Q n=1 Tax=Pectobacterium parmentieri TaxID=1905730 RepID=UPI0013C4EE38|nr:bacteriophage antitermination protein Q [Pectobacterium parmentieri]